MSSTSQSYGRPRVANGDSSAGTSLTAGAAKHISPASAEVSILKDAATGEESFVKGVGTHMWQSSGDETSNWTSILRSWHPLNFPRFAMARLTGGFTVLEKCPNSWNRYTRLRWSRLGQQVRLQQQHHNDGTGSVARITASACQVRGVLISRWRQQLQEGQHKSNIATTPLACLVTLLAPSRRTCCASQHSKSTKT